MNNSANPNPNRSILLIALIGLVAAQFALLALLSGSLHFLLVGVLVISVGVLWQLRWRFPRLSQIRITAPTTLSTITTRQALLECGAILLVAVAATTGLHDFRRDVQPSGNDLVHLTRAADFAGQFLRSSGKIPLWDPFIGYGEPMLESVQSFILNPFMSLPIMLLGAKPGVLIVILLHSALFGVGGWVWGRVMGLGAPGRLLMGALLVSSGSFTGPISHGVFQLAMSQVYIPYVYAGLIAALYLPGQRWGLVLFITATALLAFSGTFWYLLPTAFGCGLIALFALLRHHNRAWSIDTARLRVLLLAGVLVVGVVGMRVLTANRDLLHHPQNSYPYIMSYPQVFLNYVDPSHTNVVGEWFVVYHFVVPAPLLLGLATFLVLAWRVVGRSVVGGWRVIVAGVIFVLIISVFGMGPNALVNAIYDALPFIRDWRNPGRMAAAASPWVVLLAGWCFDSAVRVAWRAWRQRGLWKPFAALALIALAAAALLSALRVAQNWDRALSLVRTDRHYPTQVQAAYFLRERYPNQFLELHAGWIYHFAMNETLIRHPHGDDQVFTIGMASTMGGETWNRLVMFAYGDDPNLGNGRWLMENGNVEMPGVPVVEGIGAILDYNPDALPYAYIVPEATLVERGNFTVAGSQVEPVTYYHRIDSVVAQVEHVSEPLVLVVSEMAYPGWTVTVNGEPQPLESVTRRIAVRLPAGVEQATVVFSYQPTHLYRWGVVSLLSIALLIAYALRLDRRVTRRLLT